MDPTLEVTGISFTYPRKNLIPVFRMDHFNRWHQANWEPWQGYFIFCATKTAIIIVKLGATPQPFARNRAFVFVRATPCNIL